MPELTKAQINYNRLRQPFCASCFYCRMDCANTDRCIECIADFRETGIKTAFAKRLYNSKMILGVPEQRGGIGKKHSKKSIPFYMN